MMGLAAVQHQRLARASVICPSDQARAGREDERLDRYPLHRDRPNLVHIPLDLDAQHAAFVVMLIQPLYLSDWPGCTLFAVAIEEIHRCCSATDILHLICERVDRIIGHFYSQVTINVPQALRNTRFYPLGKSCSVSPLALQQISTQTESTAIAQKLADKLTKRIRKGIHTIRSQLESGDSLPDCFSGTAPTELRKVPRQTCFSQTSYDDILHSFLEDGGEHTGKGEASRFLAWCSNFDAGSIDSIAHCLPPRRVENSQAGEEQMSKRQQDAYRQTRKRRRDLSRLVNSIVYRLSGQPRIVYIALGVENYQFSTQVTLSSTQYEVIVSTVVEDLKKEDLAILDNRGRIYDPAHDISERAQLEFDIVSQALRDVSTLGKQTGNGEDIGTAPSLTSGSDCSNSTLSQQSETPSAPSSNTTTSSETTRVDGGGEILATAALRDLGSAVLTDRADRSTPAAAVPPWNTIASPLAAGERPHVHTTDLGSGGSLGSSSVRRHAVAGSAPNDCQYQSGTNPRHHCIRDEIPNGMEPSRKRPRLEEVYLADSQINNNPSTVTNGYTSLPHDLPPVGGTLHMIEPQEAMTAVQGTNWNFQNTLPISGPSLAANGGDIGRMQSWPSDQLQFFGFGSTPQDGWGGTASMTSWLTNELTFMGFESI